MTRSFDLPGRSPVHACNAMVATSHPLATATALSVLHEGGNAVDAAIAASATLCVVEPHMTGIGGDCFAILHHPKSGIHALNGSGRSAAKAELAWYQEAGFKQVSDQPAHTITVPGALRGWEKLHTKFGSMDWVRLFADAVDYALSGFPVAQRVAHDWAGLKEKLSGFEASSKQLLFGGEPPVTGQKICLPELGRTLETIARNGVADFYEGGIAEEIAKTVSDLGGFITVDDLAACEANWVTPISTQYLGHEVLEIPPNGQGITALILLNLLSENNSDFEPGSTGYFHELIELGRIAYAMRDCHVADYDCLQTSVERILSGQTTQSLLRQFNPRQRNDAITLPDLPSSDTIYLSVVDRDGLTVSFINSVFSGFGSGIVTPHSGIALQNRGSGFNLISGHPNAIAGSKRPLHTIIPAMVMKDGKPTHSFGVMGGAYQPMGHASVLKNMLAHGMNPQAAVDFPRLFWDDTGALLAEQGIGESVFKQMKDMGHPVRRGGLHGGGQIIAIDRESGVLTAGSDPRKDGFAAGY